MRVILDTNILISALLLSQSPPGRIYAIWKEGGFTLLSCDAQMEELWQTLHKPALMARIQPHHAGRLVNELRRLSESVDPLPRVKRSPDPDDDFLLAMAAAGRADFLVTGDKSGLLALRRHEGTRIVSAREFALDLRWDL